MSKVGGEVSSREKAAVAEKAYRKGGEAQNKTQGGGGQEGEDKGMGVERRRRGRKWQFGHL